MALNYPNSPTVGQVFDQWTWNGSFWELTPPPPTVYGVVTWYQEATPPTTGANGESWYKPSTNTFYVLEAGVWTAVTSPGGYVFVQEATPTGTTTGQTWYQTSTGASFVWYDSFWVQTAPGSGLPNPAIDLFTGTDPGKGATGITAATGPYVTPTLFTIPTLAATHVVDFQLRLSGYNTGGQGQQATIRINGTSIGQNLIVPTTSNTTPFIAAAPFRTTGRTGAAAVTVSVGEWYGNTVYNQGIDLYATVYRK